MEQNLPVKGSKYEKSGNIYTVIEIANIETTKPDTYPVTVVYRGDNGKVWATTLTNWNKKAKYLGAERFATNSYEEINGIEHLTGGDAKKLW